MESPSNLAVHVRVLGFCWVIYGVISLLVSVAMVMYSGTATVMFGALLSRVPDPYRLMSLFHLIYATAAAVTTLRSVLGLLAGLALIADRPAAGSH